MKRMSKIEKKVEESDKVEGIVQRRVSDLLRARIAPVRLPRVLLREALRPGRNPHAQVAVTEPIGTIVKRPGNNTCIRNKLTNLH